MELRKILRLNDDQLDIIITQTINALLPGIETGSTDKQPPHEKSLESPVLSENELNTRVPDLADVKQGSGFA